MTKRKLIKIFKGCGFKVKRVFRKRGFIATDNNGEKVELYDMSDSLRLCLRFYYEGKCVVKSYKGIIEFLSGYYSSIVRRLYISEDL